MAKDNSATDAEIADVFGVVYQICGVSSMYTAALGLADMELALLFRIVMAGSSFR